MGTAAAVVYQQDKERGTCTRAGCNAEHSDRSSLCAPHHEEAKRRTRESQRRLRKRRARKRVCIHCGRPRPKRSKSCLSCRIRRNRIQPIRAIASGVVGGVNKAEQIASRTRTHADGRTRYHGQGKRGMQPRAQLNRQDIEMARDALARGEKGLAMLETPDVQAMPTMERDGVREAAAHLIDLAGRHLDDVLERVGHFKARHGRRDGE